MEDKTTLESLSTIEYEGLPCLNSDNKTLKPFGIARQRQVRLKALSMPVCSKIKSVPLDASYKISEHYNLMQKLGVGAYGEVRRGVHKKTEQVFAVKVCKGTTSCNLLKNEAEFLKILSCEHIPKFCEFNHDSKSNKSYLVMEYINGLSLDQYIIKNGTVSEEEAKSFLSQLIKAVKELHSHGIAHRDIKPQNILITEDKKILLIDFNISKMKVVREIDPESRFKSIFFTQISSPMYSAPEIVSSECYSESVDIWGIGIAYAEMLFNISEQVQQIKSKTYYDFICDLQDSDEVSSESVSYLKQMLSNKPDSRPTIAELFTEFCE
jgi:serine/threonine protein kinase